jgi:hypothetical protein
MFGMTATESISAITGVVITFIGFRLANKLESESLLFCARIIAIAVGFCSVVVLQGFVYGKDPTAPVGFFIFIIVGGGYILWKLGGRKLF